MSDFAECVFPMHSVLGFFFKVVCKCPLSVHKDKQTHLNLLAYDDSLLSICLAKVCYPYACVLQVIVAAELLKHAEELVKYKIHPTSIIAGYRLACK